MKRVLAITCGYEDADDLDALRDDPGFRLALGKLPGSGAGLASQPTMSRWENAPTTRELARMMGAMIAIYCGSYPHRGRSSDCDGLSPNRHPDRHGTRCDARRLRSVTRTGDLETDRQRVGTRKG